MIDCELLTSVLVSLVAAHLALDLFSSKYSLLKTKLD